MKKAVLLAAILAGTILSQSFAADAKKTAPPKPTVQVITGKSAEAQWGYLDPTECNIVNLSVSAGDQTIQTTGSPSSRTQSIAITLEIFDQCNFVDLMVAQGFGSYDQLQVDPVRGTARLKANVIMNDQFSGNYFPLAVDLTWKATGKLQTSHDHTKTVNPGSIVIEEFLGVTRACAATGTVSDGTTDYAQDSSVEATIAASADVTTTIPTKH